MSYDNFATTFSQSRKNHPWPELDYIIEDIRKQKYLSLLDVGCGNGRFLEEWKKHESGNIHYLGIDNSIWMINEAQELHPDDYFEVFDMSKLQFTESKLQIFDAILFLASFHHLETRESRIETLRQAKKLLALNGRIYMTNWNLLSQERYKNTHQWNGDFQIKIGEFSRYYHGFTLDELGELFTQAWLEAVEHRIFEGERNILSVVK